LGLQFLILISIRERPAHKLLQVDIDVHHSVAMLNCAGYDPRTELNI